MSNLIKRALGKEYFLKDKERLEELLTDLETAFLDGAHEPSERGAGLMATNDARTEAETLLTEFLTGG